MATAAIVPVAAAPAAAAPQAHSSGSVPVTVSTAAATEQASAPITESLKRMPSVGGNYSPMDKAKLAKHTESLQAASAPSDAGFAGMVREYQDCFELAQFAERALNIAAEGAEDPEDLAMRFDSLLDELDELDEHSSAVDYCSSRFEQLLLDADAYAARQGLVGTEELKPRKTVMFADNSDPPPFRWQREHAMDNEAASAIQAAWKGFSVRLALAEAKALYNISLPAPPGFFRRIFGGDNTYDFAFCSRNLGGTATPYSFSEMLVYSSSLSTIAPDVSQQAARNSETGAPADASTSPMKDKRVKGAAARKAAVKKATEALQLAREKAIAAKKRVSVVHGELYYNHSLALKEALDLDDPYAVPAADARGVCRRIDVRWLWPGITKEMVEIAFSQYGRINHVVMEMPTWGPKTGDPVYDRRDVRYLIAYITYSDKMSAVAAVKNMQGFRFIGANQPVEHRHMEIEVRFASDRSYDNDDDDDALPASGGHGDDLDDFDPDNNPDFDSDGLSGDDDDF